MNRHDPLYLQDTTTLHSSVNELREAYANQDLAMGDDRASAYLHLQSFVKKALQICRLWHVG